jgi:hypothetical protein
MHAAIRRSCAIVSAEGGGPGLSGPTAGMNLWHFVCARLNAGDEMTATLAWNSKPPPGLGSGKLDTPLARMHLANESAPGAVAPALDAPAAAVDSEVVAPPAATAGELAELPPHPATTMIRTTPQTKRAPGGINLLVFTRSVLRGRLFQPCFALTNCVL